MDVSRRHQVRDVTRAIGARIREGRARRGMSQETLGATLGISFQQIQKYESGANRVAACTLLAIAEALDLDVPFFLPNVVAPAGRHDLEAARRDIACARAMVGEAVANLTALQARLGTSANRLDAPIPALVSEPTS